VLRCEQTPDWDAEQTREGTSQRSVIARRLHTGRSLRPKRNAGRDVRLLGSVPQTGSIYEIGVNRVSDNPQGTSGWLRSGSVTE
jgi:hypothetical protein